jgi:ABC-type sugar transport system permease subunit/ABC-type glycerol-3-phosphate transport system substrate-binding protein
VSIVQNFFSSQILRVSLAIAATLCALPPTQGEPVAIPDAPVVIRVTGYTPWAWSPPSRARRAAFQHFMSEGVDPATGRPWGELIRIEADNPLSFPGFSLKILNFAAGTGEEVVATSTGITQFYQYRDQRFLLPLNPFIWEINRDAKGRPLRLPDGSWDYVAGPDDGRVLLWPDWKNLAPAYREMVQWRGDLYGLPISSSANGLLFRRDAFTSAGLDPDHPPATWDEFLDACLRISALSTPEFPVFGIQLNASVIESYLLGLGGNLARSDTTPDGSTRWLSSVASPEMIRTVEFIRRLTLTRWIIDDQGRPFVVHLPDAPADLVHPTLGEGRWDGAPYAAGSRFTFPGRTYAANEIRTGMAFNQLGGQATEGNVKWYNLFTEQKPRIGMSLNTPERFGDFLAAFDPDLLDFAPAPAGPAGRGVFAQGDIAGLNYRLADDPATARLAWNVLSYLASSDYKTQIVHSYAREGEGIAETIAPRLLVANGYDTIAERVSPSLREYWAGLDDAVRPVIPAKNFQAITQQYLNPLFREASLNPAFDYRNALAAAQEQIQARLDFAAGDYSRVKHRGLVVVAMVVIIAGVLIATLYAIRSMLHKAAASTGVTTLGPNPRYQIMAWALLSPALLLICVFAYYPIFKALPIAFQDYSVTGTTTWVGTANFVEIFTNPAAWTALLKTAYYMTLSIGFGFFAPVVLAILMNEIRSFRYFLRTVYYLPAVIAGIVMLLLWQRFFEPTPNGLVNQIWFSCIHIWNTIAPASLEIARQPVDWLRHPVWGIPAVVFVGVWGGMGPGMLIYLAALKSIPEDLYEAAELDGAGWGARFYHITLSYLRPLLVINLIGAVIGAFQASGNILALAGNFPATYTFAVHLWFETFGLGNFGVGTALSWVMAAILMGFTLWQLRILRNVEFRRSQADD